MNRLIMLTIALTGLWYGSSFSQQPVFGPPANLGPKINTALHQLDPFLTADGKKLFFADGADIWFSEMADTGWTNAVKLGPQINYGIHLQVSPSVSPDGQKLYYVDASRDDYNWDIWVSTWDFSINDWGAAQNLGWPVNTQGIEHSVRIGSDGQHLYFYSSVSDSVDSLNPNGRCGFYVSEWAGTDWSIPTSFGANYYCASSDYPSITADLKELFYHQYVSDGTSIFVNCLSRIGWGPQIDLRSQIGGRAATPFITPSGDSLFFSGTPDLGGNGGADIWMIKRILSGDLNLDSQLTTADIVLELNKVFAGEPFSAPAAAGELNCDGQFSPVDVVLILRLVFEQNTLSTEMENP